MAVPATRSAVAGWLNAMHSSNRKSVASSINKNAMEKDTLTPTMQRYLDHGMAPEALRLYRLCVLSGVSATPCAEGKALEALQCMGSSQWHSSRRMLMCFAAENGVDTHSGEYISGKEKRPSDDVRDSQRAASSPRCHPAWRIDVQEATVEEEFEMTVARNMQTVRFAFQLLRKAQSSVLATSFGLLQAHHMVASPQLRCRVLPWTMATVLLPIAQHYHVCKAVDDAVVASLWNPSRCHLHRVYTNDMLGVTQQHHMKQPQLGASSLQSRVMELVQRVPKISSETTPLQYLCTASPHIDDMWLSRLAAFLFDASSSSPLPHHLEYRAMKDVFPRVCAVAHTQIGTMTPAARLHHVIRRTIRDDVSQGILIPDADFIAHSFERVVALSQHREIVLTFQTMMELVAKASPDSEDWAKYHIRTQLTHLLSSITTQKHLTRSQLSRDNYGGVTVLGLIDELAMYDACGAQRCAWTQMETTCDSAESVALTAKYFQHIRRSQGNENDAVEDDPIGQLLSSFRRAGKKRKTRDGGIGNVTVLSRSPRVQQLCYVLGVHVMV